MKENISPEKSPWGWKAVIIFSIGGVLFLALFYLAMENEPDYMPSNQAKQNTQQHAFKNAPTMSKEDLDKAQADKAEREALATQPATTHHMSEAEHTNMSTEEHAQMSEHSGGHGH